ncbi:MAG: hypothetical protein J0L63_08745 [Anaerolineae bacterium]|nr:hypothetical protein [Anaerolineae bacterium]
MAAAVIGGGNRHRWRAVMAVDGGKMGTSRFWLREFRSWRSPRRQSRQGGGSKQGIRRQNTVAGEKQGN